VSRFKPSLGSDAVSPTAHYTGEAWVRNGLSHSRLATWQGRVLFDVLRPPIALSRALGGPTLEGLLLARHRIIDSVLEQLIETGVVGQVIEAASGMSPRGWRFSERYGDRLSYIEGDLPEMARRKRAALARMGSLSDTHRVVELDVLSEDGPASLAEVSETLDRDRGLAIVTEGLLTYLDDPAVASIWRRFAAVLGEFPTGCYLADLRLAGRAPGVSERAFELMLTGFVRGDVYTHFADDGDAATALKAAGFQEARVHRGDDHAATADLQDDPGAALIRVVEGRTDAIPD
jgi:O-methyltransferase involved in polyketide biosynthesis